MITEAQGMRISFKELLLLKGVVDAISKYGYKDEQGISWVGIGAAAKGLSKQSLTSVIDKAIGNGLIVMDGDDISLTKLGAKLLKAAEPSYASKLAQVNEAVVPEPTELTSHKNNGHALIDAARADDEEAFRGALETHSFATGWMTDDKLKKLMGLVRKGKKVFTVVLDYTQSTASEETKLRRATIEFYKQHGYTQFDGTENADTDELIYIK